MLNQEKYIRYAAELPRQMQPTSGYAARFKRFVRNRSGLIPEEDMQVIFQKMNNWLDCRPEG